MAREIDRATWRWRHDLEAVAQLKLDLHDCLGRLLTRCYSMAQADPSCAAYWTGEARYWQQQYSEAMKLIDLMASTAGHPLPAPGVQAVPTAPTAQLHAALLAAFDEPDLRQMARFQLSIDLDQVAGGHDLSERVFNLISWAARTGRTADLIAGAQRQNPTNTELKGLTV